MTWDEQGSDAIHFTKYWKTFKNVKGCNLEGYLEKEPVLSVFLTRGCPLDKSFHVGQFTIEVTAFDFDKDLFIF